MVFEKLGAGGQTELGQVAQQPTGEVQAVVDVEAAVELRVVHQPLPPDRRAWLLEVDAHHDAEVVRQAVGLGLE